MSCVHQATRAWNLRFGFDSFRRFRPNHSWPLTVWLGFVRKGYSHACEFLLSRNLSTCAAGRQRLGLSRSGGASSPEIALVFEYMEHDLYGYIHKVGRLTPEVCST